MNARPGGAIQRVDHPVTVAMIAPQASSDDEMVALWLRTFRSKGTRRGYAGDVQAFRAFVAKPLGAVTVSDIQEYDLSLAHLSSSTVCRRLSAVKSLIKMARQLGYLAFDVGLPIKLPGIKNTLTERRMAEEDTWHMLRLERHPRNAALLRLIYSAGLRISEACGLHWRDLVARDHAGEATGQVNVFGKGSKTRVVLLPATIWACLTAMRGSAGPDDAVFLSRKSGPLQPRQVARIVKRAAMRAKLSHAISPHWLRHAHATHALERGCPVHILQATLGHASLTTTTRYAHASPDNSSARYLKA